MSNDDEFCPFCNANLQDRPVCRVCGCERDFDSETEAKAIRLNHRIVKNLHLPVYEVPERSETPEPEPPKAPRAITVGVDLESFFQGVDR